MAFYWKEMGTPYKCRELKKEKGYEPGERQTNIFRHST
jgi:hypothetical protein